jgi:membrane-bound lytic murein transglycosylase D
VNAGRDERFDPQKSSVAAAKYLQTLLKTFGNDRYLLALAAYNTGQNRVLRRKLAQTVRRSQDADFWHLKQELPKETLDYVPRILAAIIIARNPDRF